MWGDHVSALEVTAVCMPRVGSSEGSGHSMGFLRQRRSAGESQLQGRYHVSPYAGGRKLMTPLGGVVSSVSCRVRVF